MYQEVARAISSAAAPLHLSANQVSQIEMLQELSKLCNWQPLWPNVKETLREELARDCSKMVAPLPDEDSWPDADLVVAASRVKRVKKSASACAAPGKRK